MAVVASVPRGCATTRAVGDLGDVIAPPYDVISPAEQAALYARSPHNVIRLILPREADRGAGRGARRCASGCASGVLAQDAAPGALPLRADASRSPTARSARARRRHLPARASRTSRSGVVRPHERTLPGPKADRLALLRATGANLSPIFGALRATGRARRATSLGVAGARRTST